MYSYRSVADYTNSSPKLLNKSIELHMYNYLNNKQHSNSKGLSSDKKVDFDLVTARLASVTFHSTYVPCLSACRLGYSNSSKDRNCLHFVLRVWAASEHLITLSCDVGLLRLVPLATTKQNKTKLGQRPTLSYFLSLKNNSLLGRSCHNPAKSIIFQEKKRNHNRL